MNDQIIATYCICDEIAKVLKINDDPQCRMTTPEIMTFAIYSASFCFGDYRRARLFASCNRLFPRLLSHGRLVQRIHAIPEQIWILVFQAMQVLIRNPDNHLFIVDSFPVKTYENHKSFRARIFCGKEYHGYSASRKQYFFGIKVHMIVDSDGIPIEFAFTPGSHSDIRAFRNLSLCLKEGAKILADCAYLDYDFEAKLELIEGITLLSRRKRNSKRQRSFDCNHQINLCRNRVETVFSSITSRMPRHIRARTEKGFCLKIMFFIFAYMIQKFCPLA